MMNLVPTFTFELWPLCFPSAVLVSTQVWDRVGSFSGIAFSHNLGPKGSGDPSVFYTGPKCPLEHLTQRSCPRRPGYAGSHSTSSEFQLSSGGIGTLPCDQPHTLLTPAQVGGREFATTMFPWALARKDIPLSPKGKPFP